MHASLGGRAGLETKQTPLIDEIHQEITSFRERFGKRLSHISELPLVPGFVYAKLAEGKGRYHPLLILGLFIGITLLAFAVERAYRRGARRLYEGLALPEDAQPLQRLGRMLAQLCLDLTGVVVFAASIFGHVLSALSGTRANALDRDDLVDGHADRARVIRVFTILLFSHCQQPADRTLR